MLQDKKTAATKNTTVIDWQYMFGSTKKAKEKMIEGSKRQQVRRVTNEAAHANSLKRSS
jgi:hypothetical protein